MRNALLFFLFSIVFCVFGSPAHAAEQPPDLSWTERVITEEELLSIERADPALDVNTCREMLSRLNIREYFYIREAMRLGQKLKVPNNFNDYRRWTPLPERLPRELQDSKLILVVKSIPFVGWYESGKLVGDSQACIGYVGEDTRAGIYCVEEKDAQHVSRSYSNDYGNPAWMPFSLRIYGTVWIHAGNVFSTRCSHGCIVLPIEKAEILFKWADPGTRVLVVESL